MEAVVEGSARNLDANEVIFALAEQIKCAARVAMSVTILSKFSLISQMMKIADHSV